MTDTGNMEDGKGLLPSPRLGSDPAATVLDSGGGGTHIWGPTDFTPFELALTDERQGGARQWIDRALVSYYFLKHDNEPAPFKAIYEWIDALTPDDVLDAMATMGTIGLP